MVRLAACLLVLLSGCMVQQEAPLPSPPAQEFLAGCDEPGGIDRCVEVAGAPGVHLRGSSFAWGQYHLVQVSAVNAGNATWWVKAEDCGGKPWHDLLERDGARVQKDPPGAVCAICSWRPFAPGETIRDSFEWDELEWNQDSTRDDAPAGSYTWTLRLDLRQDTGCGPDEAVHGDLVFPITLK